MQTTVRLDATDRRIVRLAIPALGSLAVEPLYVLVDTAIVGRLGTAQLGGLALAASVLSLVTAGRDPGTHGDDASTFDATRPTRRDHLAFGHGVHHCLGRLLAMSEATTALPALFERFPDMRPAVPADELGLLESFISSGHTELPVLLTPTF